MRAAAGLGVLVFLQHQDTRRPHPAQSRRGRGPRDGMRSGDRHFGSTVARMSGKSADAQRRNRGLGPPATTTSASPYSIMRADLADAMQAGGAGRHDRHIRALETETHGHMPCNHVDDGRGNKKRRYAPRTPAGQFVMGGSIMGRPPMPEPMLQPMRVARSSSAHHRWADRLSATA
jgi:hypothetical protein